jgi:hypothetical protein
MKKSLIASMVFATATFGSLAGMAQAAPIGNTPQVLDLTDGSGFFGDVFGASNNGGTFADRFTFSVAGTGGPQNFDAIVSSISRTAATGLDITNLSLYRATGGSGGGGGGDTLVSSGTSLQSGAIDVWTLTSNSLNAGDYYIQVSGNMVSNTSAAFGGAVMLAPVPEPETYGTMLAGLGIVGYLARRRKAAANQA